jgi:hypothetical protein
MARVLGKMGTREAFEVSETHNDAQLILLLDDYF